MHFVGIVIDWSSGAPSKDGDSASNAMCARKNALLWEGVN